MITNDDPFNTPKEPLAGHDKWLFREQRTSGEERIDVSTSHVDGIKSSTELVSIIEELFRTQYLAVLSTQKDGAPYGNLVAFASADNLTRLIFVTPRATRKFSNMLAEPRVAMVIDNRSNDHIDFSKAMAVTATGTAIDSRSLERNRLLAIFLNKHPHLKEFAESPSCAVMSIEVETYYCVYRFQNVMELHLRK